MAKFLTLEDGKMVLRELQSDSGFPFSLKCVQDGELYTIMDCRQIISFACFEIQNGGELNIEDGGELVILG